jgi:hypothetical protein
MEIAFQKMKLKAPKDKPLPGTIKRNSADEAFTLNKYLLRP